MTVVTNPTLLGGASKVFTSSTSSTLTLYGVQSETIRKSANLLDFPMPTADSNEKLLFDLMGTSREITVEGIFVTGMGSITDSYKYAADLAGLGNHSLINGSQGNTTYQKPGYDYTSEIMNRGNSGSVITIRVYVNDVTITGEKGNPNSFNYSITLLECSGSSSG